MPALDSILPTANAVVPGDGESGPASETQPDATAEPFDDLMARALSPDSPETSAPTGQNGTVASSGKSPCQIQASGQTDSSSNIVAQNIGPLQPQNSQTGTASSGKSKTETEKKSSANVSTNNKNRSVSGDASGLGIQLLTPLPFSAIPLPLPGVEANSNSKGGTVPAVPWLPTKAGAADANSNGVLTEKISSPNTSEDKSAVASAASPDPDETRKIAAAINAMAADNTASSAVKPASLPVGTPQNPVAKEAGNLLPAEVFQATAAHLRQFEGSVSSVRGAKTPAANGGTSAAKSDMPMKNTEEMNKVAGLDEKDEKVLPGNVISLAQEKNLPTDAADVPVSLHGQRSNTITDISPTAISTATAVSAPTGEALTASSIIDLRARAVDRTYDMVALQAGRLEDSSLTSLQVVIKPGAGMQLSLELRQHGDGVDAQAVLQRGDMSYLSQHWPELQQRLEQRGVRLAPLTGQENFGAGNGQNGFQQSPQQQSAEQDPLFASAFAEFALSAPASSSIPSTAHTAHPGWETWA
jgi:hypothetical protein